jgi:hypothetical protein
MRESEKLSPFQSRLPVTPSRREMDGHGRRARAEAHTERSRYSLLGSDETFAELVMRSIEYVDMVALGTIAVSTVLSAYLLLLLETWW